MIPVPPLNKSSKKLPLPFLTDENYQHKKEKFMKRQILPERNNLQLS